MSAGFAPILESALSNLPLVRAVKAREIPDVMLQTTTSKTGHPVSNSLSYCTLSKAHSIRRRQT